MNNDTFLSVYSKARARAFKDTTIRSAYRATGLIPFRREAALRPDAMAPALDTSVKGGFPNLLPSPVRAIVDAHQKWKGAVRGTAVPALEVVDELDETSDEVVGTGVNEAQIALGDSLEACGDRRIFSGAVTDSNGVLVQATDNDMGADLSAALCPTSARFLVSDSPLKSTSRLAAPIIQSVPMDLRPDFSILGSGPKNLDRADKTVLSAEVRRLRTELRKAEQVSRIERSINEAANAQLVLQDLHLGGLVEQLHTKEDAKVNKKRKKMASKNARWLTGAPFMNELRGIVEEEEGQPAVAAGDPSAGGVDVEEVAIEVLDPLPGETKTKWRERERAERVAKQKAVLAEWEKKVEECESRGVPAPFKPKVRKLFPAPATPPSLRTKRTLIRGEVVSDDVEVIDIDVVEEGDGEIRGDFEDN